ncbi:Rho GTPase-activating protein 12-like protein, partial [Dinothrombium tinctorium]
MNRGEKFRLLQKTNNDWWLVKKLHLKTSNYSNSVSLMNSNHYRSDEELDLNEDSQEDNSFYAPANYLREIEIEIEVPSPKIKKVELLSNSLNESEYSCDSADEIDSGNHDDAEVSSNTAATSSKESLIDESSDWKTNCDNEQESKLKTVNTRSESPPIYVNLPLNCKNSPPVPNSGTAPIRILLNHWAEYMDENGRKYYYNSVSRESSWKPPRRRLHRLKDDEEVTSHSEENLTDSSTTSLTTLSNVKDKSQTLSDLSPKPFSRTSKLRNKTKTTKEKSEFKQSENIYSPHSLTEGWTRHYDAESNTMYFVNDKTKGKWFAKNDENGRLYFYEENGTQSYWELPNLEDQLADDDEETIEISVKDEPRSTTESTNGNNSLPRNSRFVPTPVLPSPVPTQNRLVALNRSIKAKSMAFLPITDCLAASVNIPIALMPKEAPSGDAIKNLFPPEPPQTLQDAKFIICVMNESNFNSFFMKKTKDGILNRTKIMENGRRIRKNWCPCFVALTNYYLMLFKETKSISGSLKPEITIDLSRASIEWSEKSSRKNVFQITTEFGQQILLQDDYFRKTDNTGKDEVTVPQVFSNIPAEKKKKIRERLRQFLRRRPTLDIIREKGIYKDEPVFGCNLITLCQSEKQNVPKFVQQCIDAIEKKDLKADGIYRACGNLSQVQKIRFQVNQDNYSGIWAEEDVHVLTGALKLFFRDMKEPLFPCSIFESIMKAIALPEKNSKFEAIYKLVKELPTPNYETLKFLLQHLL